MTDVLVHAPNTLTFEFDLADAGKRAGLVVRRVRADRTGWFDLAGLVSAAEPGAAYRCAGGPLAAAIRAGADIRLYGATSSWFSKLPVELTGRSWQLTTVPGARAALADGPVFIKLADGKFGPFPARRYTTVTDFDAALATVHASDGLALLMTSRWLDIDSEYRVFTHQRAVLTYSPYLVQDDPWTPLLRTHRASFHDDAAQFANNLLMSLPDGAVPPTAVLDIARLRDGQFIVLEQITSGPLGCTGATPTAPSAP